MARITKGKLLMDFGAALKKAKPEELAEMRQRVRAKLGLPERREPVLEAQEEEQNESEE